MAKLLSSLPSLKELQLKDLEEIYAETSGEYETTPVSIDTFINDPYYLGNSFINKETQKPDGSGLYKYWRPILNKIYPSPFYSPYYLINLRGCFSGDTSISTLNGHVPIKEIATRWFKGERDFWVLSWNIDTNSFEPDKVTNAFSTGEEQLYEITLDNDEVIKCTANHKFLTKDNNWVSIDDGLVVNTSLKPYYWKESSGYHQVKVDGNWEYRYNIVSKWKSCKEKGIHTHHKDFNKLNDNPSNISLLTKKQHLKIHADSINLYHNKWRKQIGEEEYLRLAKERLKNASDLLWYDSSYSESRDKHRISLSNHMKTSGQSQKMGQKGGKITGKRNITKYNKSKQGREESVKRASHMRNLLERKTDEEKRLIKLKQGLGTLRGLKNRCLKCKEVKEGYCKEHTQKIEKKLNEIRKLDTNYNHSVIKIKRLQIEPVFDITTEKNHNFTLSSGIVAHNSIGSGKTSIGSVIVAYEIYLQLCKINPQLQYGLMPDTKLVIFIFNILLTLASDVTWSTLSALFVKSPFFQSLLELKKDASPEDKLKWPKSRNTLFPKKIDIRVGSNITHTLGQCLTCAIFDEIAFGVLTNQVTKALNSAIGRIRSRLGADDDGVLNGKVVLISSESDVGSEMNKIMNKYKTDPGVLIVSDPLWKVKPEQFSTTTFPVFIGSDSKQPEIIGDSNQYLLDSEPDHILQIPTSCRREVTQDIHTFLRDIGGIATASSYKLFRLRDRVYKSLTMTNIFPEINALDFDDPDKNILFKRCTHPSYFKKPFYPNKPRHVHIDLGITEDRCGIACGYIPEFLQRSTLEDHEDPEKIFDIIPKINFDFAFACAPTSGKRLPIYRLKEFLFYLRDELEYPIMSVSLDGFQCFTGDTKISLLNGTEVMIKDLVGKEEFWVYSCDSNGNVVPGRGHSARITGKQAKILKVTLDNGKEIRCTENHRFMLRDGTYKEAQYLTVNDSLMPLYRQRKTTQSQYEKYYNPNTRRWLKNRNIFKEDCIYCQQELNEKEYKNHTVVKVEECGYEDVYDIEVDKYHNFALTAGVFVHNSENILQDFKRAGFNTFLISVDRTANPYLQYRTAVYEGRIIHPKSQLLGSELVELEISPDGKKVDHPQLDVKGDKASKDLSDCTCAISHQLHTNLEDYRNAELYTAIEDGALDEADEYEEILNELDDEFKSYTVMDQLFHKE